PVAVGGLRAGRRRAADIGRGRPATVHAMVQHSVVRALVPDASGTRLLVSVPEPPALPALPVWTLEDGETVDSIREARTRFGIATPFLREVRYDGDPLPDAELSLV